MIATFENLLFLAARYLSIFLLIGLCIISTLYAVGNLVTIQAENLICPLRSKEEIREINYLTEHESGDIYSCRYIDTQKLNFRAIYNLHIGIYTASFGDNIDIFDATLFVFYSFIVLISMILTIYHGYYLVYDSYYLVVTCVKCPTSNTGSTGPHMHPHLMNPRFKKTVEECSKQYHRSKMKHKRQRTTKRRQHKKKIRAKSQSCLQKCCHSFGNVINIYTFYFRYFLF